MARPGVMWPLSCCCWTGGPSALLPVLDWPSLTALRVSGARLAVLRSSAQQRSAYSGPSLHHACVSRVAGVRVPLDLADQGLDERSRPQAFG